MANISKIKVGNTSYGITATPTAHASTATTYGAASASNYGHVKLSDNYTSSAGAAASGIGASSLAVYNAYNTLNSNLKWKYWKSAFGTTSITLPEKYEELILEVERGESNIRYSIHVVYAQLTWTINNPGTELCFKAGQCTTSTNYESVSVIATTTYARIYTVYDSGQNITASSELRVYYR